MKRHTAIRGKGWLSGATHGPCLARYFMVADRTAGSVRGILRTELAIASLASLDGSAMLQMADGQILPIQIVKAYASGAVFAAPGTLI